MSAPLDLEAAARYITELAERDLDLDSPIPAAMLALVKEWQQMHDLARELLEADPRPVKAHYDAMQGLASATALLAECRRQRAEIERLRGFLLDAAGLDRNGTPCYCDAFASGSTRHTEACKATARAALQQMGDGA